MLGYRINLLDLNRSIDDVPEEIDESLLEEGQAYFDHDAGRLRMKIRDEIRTFLFEDVHSFDLGDNPTVHTGTWFYQRVNETFDLAGGKYLVLWSYQWSCDSTSRDFRAKAWIDGAIAFEQRQEAKDSGGSFGNTGTDQRHLSTWSSLEDLAAGPHTFQFSYAPSQNNIRASLWNVRLTVVRVAS